MDGAHRCQHRRFVFLVDLSKIQLPDALPVAICLALGLSLQANLSPLDLLLKTVPELEAVLILDACENIKDAVATLVVQLLQAGPGLSILVTSRVPIQVQSAEGYAMLLSPARNRVQAEFEEIPLEPLEPLLAARLLIELFQRQDPEFNVSNESVPLITDLVVRVKGVPLAIEMVAGQASESGLQSAYQSLTRTLQTLDDSKVNQLTAEIVRWRLAQLTAQERTVLQALSLFVSGAAWESLMRVLEREKIGASLLDQLKDRLLMDYNPKSSRVRLHELIRKLCLSDLSKSDPYRGLCAGYLDWSKDFVERWTPQLEAAEGLTTLQHLVLERENIERAIDLALENQAIEHAYVISAKLFRFWLILGNVLSGLELYERVLSHRYHGQPKLGVLIGAGALAISKGDLQQGANYYESGLQTALVLQDQTAIVQMRQNLAVVYARTKQYEKAESEFLLVLEVATSSGDQRLQSSCLMNLANCLVASGSQDLDRIKRLYEESLEMLIPLDDLIRIATVWNNLGVLLHKMGDLHGADSAYQESLTIKSRLQDRLGTASTLTNIGLIQAKLGRMTDGLISFKNALQILIELHLPLAVPGLPGNLARCLYLMGRYPESAMLFGASEQLYQELGNKSVHDEEERKIWMDELKTAMGKTAFQKKYTKGGKISGLEVLKFAQEIIESDDARESDI
jgi:non-specific serine/threonine protein kinase